MRAMLRALVRLLLIVSVGFLMTPRVLAQQAGAAPSGTRVAPSSAPADAGGSAPAQAAPEAPAAPAVVAPVAPVENSAVAAPEAQAPAPTAAPQAAPAPAAVPAKTALAAVPAAPGRDVHDAVRFVDNDGRHVTLFERKGDKWQRVCTSPCYFKAADGPRDYAAPTKVAAATTGYRVAGKGIWLANGDGLQADYQDRVKIRSAGVGVLLAGLLTLAFLAPALDAKNTTAAKAAVFTTSGVLSVSGLIMLLMKDRVQLSRCAGCNAGPRAATPAN
jgi:hypothetical protein